MSHDLDGDCVKLDYHLLLVTAQAAVGMLLEDVSQRTAVVRDGDYSSVNTDGLQRSVNLLRTATSTVHALEAMRTREGIEWRNRPDARRVTYCPKCGEINEAVCPGVEVVVDKFGKCTNRYADGTTGVVPEHRLMAEECEYLLCYACGESVVWKYGWEVQNG